MKKSILLTFVFILTITMGFSQSKTDITKASFGVRGNCGMCKATIEKAVNNIDGVSSAIWDRDNKIIDVSFDVSKTNLMEMHKAISFSGYDTEMSIASEESYNNLPGCCQYDRQMKINISPTKKEDHSDHKH